MEDSSSYKIVYKTNLNGEENCVLADGVNTQQCGVARCACGEAGGENSYRLALYFRISPMRPLPSRAVKGKQGQEHRMIYQGGQSIA